MIKYKIRRNVAYKYAPRPPKERDHWAECKACGTRMYCDQNTYDVLSIDEMNKGFKIADVCNKACADLYILSNI